MTEGLKQGSFKPHTLDITEEITGYNNAERSCFNYIIVMRKKKIATHCLYYTFNKL